MINDYMVLMNHTRTGLYLRLCDGETESYKGKPFLFHSHTIVIPKPIEDDRELLDKLVEESENYFRIIQGDVIFINSMVITEGDNQYTVGISFATNDRM